MMQSKGQSQDLPEEKADLEKEKDLEWYRERYRETVAQNRDLEAQVFFLQEQYNVISNAAFWKATKPFRVLADGTKKLLRKSRVLKKIWHGLKYWKQHGFRAAWKRTFTGKRGMAKMQIEELMREQREHPLEADIRFSILVPLYNTDRQYLTEMIRSVIEQTYPEWELCLADGSDENHAYVGEIARSFAEQDPRVKYSRLEKNEGISGNTNACEKAATGNYLAFLDHDDLLSPFALYLNAKAILESHADVLYSDEDHLSKKGKHVHPFFKPDWSPDLLHSQMYICHFTVIRKALFDQIGGFRSAFDGSQDYDLMLRLTEKTDRIVHIPAILYTWRECEGSTAANADAKPYAHEAGRKALDEHLKRVYGEDAHADDGDYTFVYDARFGTLRDQPLVSVIIPMKDHAETSDACVESILQKTTYPNYEILILDNRSEKPETFAWFEKIEKRDPRIRVLKADMEFNWSKINNFGMNHSNGEVYVLLNNDTVVISPDWLERLAENALRKDVGVVGALLVYEDETIQHAGVVVGLGGLADHVFKGMKTVHFGAPFVSPMVTRNTLAVTGACLAISRARVEEIGGLDESFIICGSDVELCLRAYEYGYFNVYSPKIKLYHLESKSRDSYIPPIDFRRSMQSYQPYFENGDPYFNDNLSLNSLVPEENEVPMNLIRVKRFIKRFPPVAALCRSLRMELMPSAECNVPEIGAVTPRADKSGNRALRLNLLTPSVDFAHVFGGISTALKFFESLRKELNCDARIITTDADVVANSSVASSEYQIVPASKDSDAPLQLVAFNDRFQKTIPVRENDIFVATAWWTAYTFQDVILWQKEQYHQEKTNPLIYIIQDYEPGFYPWSSRYMLADSTYRLSIPTYAVMNSGLLKEFFDRNGYSFAKTWFFEPILNEKLAGFLPETAEVPKKKQILVYGRPGVDRNAFALVVETLKLWAKELPDAREWIVYSAGEEHRPVDLGNGCVLQSLGKLSLEDYAKTMLDTYAGLSLMVSPHPSYPPLEMSTFGIKTITNCYANKDLRGFNGNMISVENCAPRTLADELLRVCSGFDQQGTLETANDYARGGAVFGNIASELCDVLKQRGNN